MSQFHDFIPYVSTSHHDDEKGYFDIMLVLPKKFKDIYIKMDGKTISIKFENKNINLKEGWRKLDRKKVKSKTLFGEQKKSHFFSIEAPAKNKSKEGDCDYGLEIGAVYIPKEFHQHYPEKIMIHKGTIHFPDTYLKHEE